MKLFGFEFYRQAAGSHEIWYNSQSNRFITIPNHAGDMPEGTLRAILKQADINPDQWDNEADLCPDTLYLDSIKTQNQ